MASNWVDLTHPQSLFTAIPGMSQPSYYAFGGLGYGTLGSGVNLSRWYDPRMRITGETERATGATAATSGSATVTITGAEQSK
jgi:hypothetical protein